MAMAHVRLLRAEGGADDPLPGPGLAPAGRPGGTMNYRAGIIGCGSIAAAHARGYQGAGVELVAAADPVARARDGLQERFGIPKTYAGAEEMLRAEALDLVS